MNDMEVEKDVLEDIPSSETTTIDYIQTVEQLEKVNLKLDTLCNLSIVLLVGLGIVVGVLCSNIFSRYFKS